MDLEVNWMCMTLKISNKLFNSTDVDRIIEMAWEDRTPFEAISFQFDIKEKEVIVIMRSNLKASSFKLWRKRVNGRKLKHGFPNTKSRFKSPNQKWKINWPKIAPSVKRIFNGEKNGLKIGEM